MALLDSPKRKIVELSALLAALQDRRAQGATVVQCHGCFDIVHPGHVRHLEFASRQGDVLVVTLTGDAGINKAAQRPYIPQELRAENLAALQFVDYVYIDPSPTAESALEAIRPDAYVKGREYATSTDPRFAAERRVVESYGGRVIFSSGDVVFSSSSLIASLPRQDDLEAERMRLVCRRHHINQARLDELLGAFRGLRVGVVGDVVIDRYVFCDAVDVASEAPVLSLARLSEQSYVGGAAIVARHVAALGAQPFLLSVPGEDPATAQLMAVLGEEGVEYLPVGTRSRLVEKTRFLVEDRKLLKVEDAAVEPLDSRAEKQAAMLLEQRCRGAQALILCDFGYGTITPSLLQRVLPSIRTHVHVLSGAASGPRGNMLGFRNVDLLCASEREMRNTLHNYEEGLSSVAYRLVNEVQARHMICTLGQRGLVAFDRPTQDRQSPDWTDRLLSEHFPAFSERSVDILGVNDALLAAATLALAAGGTLIQSAYLGNALAGLQADRLGNAPLGLDALSEALRQRRELHAAVPQVRAPHRRGSELTAGRP